MDTTENPTTGANKAQQTAHVSIDEWIMKMRIAFTNAKLPGIYEVMLEVGYTNEKIDDCVSKLTVLEGLHQTRNKEMAEQVAETDKFDSTREAIDAQFMKHRKLSKILFKGDVQAQSALQLDTNKPAAFAAWQQLVLNFYQQLSSIAAFKTKATTVGITEAVINGQLQALNELQALKNSQRKELSEAQAATDARDKAFDELYPLYTEYIQYAKVLLADNQALEAIGVRVKAKQ